MASAPVFDYPEVESIVLLRRAGCRIVEIPVGMAQRASGRSSISVVRGVYYLLKVCLAVLVHLLAKPGRNGDAAMFAAGGCSGEKEGSGP